MGWMWTEKPAGQSVREFFAEEMGSKYEDGSVGRVVDCAVVNLREAYIAYKRAWPDGRREVSAVVCLLDYRPQGVYRFGYKSMDEEMHPYCYNCPERIFKQLTPTDNESAARWREECWKRIRDQQARPKLPKLREGMVIRFDEPIPFRDGSREAEFRIVDPRRMIAVVPGGWSRYKLSRRTIQNRAWQVVNAV